MARSKPHPVLGHTCLVTGRTLYVADLDGTLLGPDARVSEFTAHTLEQLMNDGVLITCATGRSWVTAQRVLGTFQVRLPVVLHDGTFIYDAVSDELLDQHVLSEPTVRSIVNMCRESGVPPLLYGMSGTQEQVSWVTSESNEGLDRFFAARPADPRNAPRDRWRDLPTDGVFSIAATGASESVHLLSAQIRRQLGDACEVTVQQDTYHPQDTWMAVVAANVSKAAAITRLALMVEATRVVVFGDNINDLPMFEIADESYAVANAVAEVRLAATAVIGANHQDGVARWLSDHAVAPE